MVDAADLHRSEFEALRQEINNRTTIQNTFIAVELTALGVGLSFGKGQPDLFIALAVITTLLWLSFVHQSTMIFKIAAYIGLELGPRLTAAAGEPVLQWESFLRRFRPEGRSTILLPGRVTRGPLAEPTSELYPLVLFGATGPLLSGLYIVTKITSGQTMNVLSSLAVAATVLVWLHALIRVVAATRWGKRIDALIRAGTDGRSV